MIVDLWLLLPNSLPSGRHGDFLPALSSVLRLPELDDCLQLLEPQSRLLTPEHVHFAAHLDREGNPLNAEEPGYVHQEIGVQLLSQ